MPDPEQCEHVNPSLHAHWLLMQSPPSSSMWYPQSKLSVHWPPPVAVAHVVPFLSQFGHCTSLCA